MNELLDRIAELEAQNAALRRENGLLRSGIDPEASYVEAFADGANLDAVWKQAQAETLGLPIV